jgi:hypothetical protein
MSNFYRPSGALDRRELLQVGGLSLLGLNSLDLARLRAETPSDSSAARHRDNSCVFIFLFGGPSHIDLWDMKPDAPIEVRGDFNPIATNVPGIQLCEHLPKLARQMDKFALLRSMTHHMPVHGPACSEMYTGREYFGPPKTDQARPEDWPSVSSLVTRYGTSPGRLPPSVVLPLHSQFIGQSKRIAGQTGGRMGEQFNAVLIECDPSKRDFEVEGFSLLPGVGTDRLAQRRGLLRDLQNERSIAAPDFGQAGKTYASHSKMAYSMLSQAAFPEALDLKKVPTRERERYGYSKFGQSLLLARQFIEAGISLVTVNFDHESKHDKRSPMWDTHHDNFAKLKDPLCPLFDHAFATFLEDLDERGLRDTTLVVATGEFGRTPKVGQFSQNAMTLKTGRDHWPHAFTALLAGGGVRGGQVYGATTSNGGYVADQPVSPADLAATMLHHLGIDTTQQYDDHFQHVLREICEGRPIRNLG